MGTDGPHSSLAPHIHSRSCSNFLVTRTARHFCHPIPRVPCLKTAIFDRAIAFKMIVAAPSLLLHLSSEVLVNVDG